MIRKTAKIINKLGLHARPSAMLVNATGKFVSEVFISKGDLRINAKSIMGVMILAAEQGTELVIECDGPDEEAAMEAVLKVIESGFGEEI